MHHAELHFGGWKRLLSGLAYACQNCGRIIRVDQLRELIETVGDFAIRIPEARLEPRIHVDLVGLEVPLPDTDAARRSGHCIAFLRAPPARSLDEEGRDHHRLQSR